ncbi:MAG TPA: cation:proton antiporter [Candidatus Dormibacteraeota bacterium]|nr:cation:proton antiporter [Candidatus Dormibacteraeota bacterium]
MPHPVATIDAAQLEVFFLQCGLLLALALVLGRLAARLAMPAVVGELLAGALMGPSVLGHLAPGFSAWLLPQRADQFHLLDAVGQVAVVLLVGITGMQVDVGMIRRQGATAARVSAAGLLVPLGLGIGCGFLVPASLLSGPGGRTVFALFLGVALCVTAIPVIAKTLMDMDLLHRNVGQLTLAAGMVDDALGWLMLAVVSALAVTGVRAGQVAFSIAALAGVVLVAATVGRPLAARVLRLAARSTERGVVAAATVVMLLLAAAGTQALGFEAVLGAFVAGIAIGSCGALDPPALAPLRSVVATILAPLFFATAGLRIDLTELRHPEVLAAAVAILLVAIVGKFSGAAIGALTSRLGRWEALALGASMNARGVIQIVVANVGVRVGVLNTASYTIVILVAVVTSLMAAPILRWAMGRVEHTPEEHERRAAHAGFAAWPTTARD